MIFQGVYSNNFEATTWKISKFIPSMSQEKTRKKSRSITLCWFRGITSKSALSQSLRPRVGWSKQRPNDFMIQESLDGIISSTWFLHMQRGLFLLCKHIPGTRNLNIHEQGEYGSSEESKWICETRHMRAFISSCPSITSIHKKWNLEISVSSSSVVMSSHILRSFLGLATNGGSHCLKGNLYEHVRNVSWTCLCSCMSIRIFEKQVHAKPCTCRHVYIIKNIHTYYHIQSNVSWLFCICELI